MSTQDVYTILKQDKNLSDLLPDTREDFLERMSDPDNAQMVYSALRHQDKYASMFPTFESFSGEFKLKKKEKKEQDRPIPIWAQPQKKEGGSETPSVSPEDREGAIGQIEKPETPTEQLDKPAGPTEAPWAPEWEESQKELPFLSQQAPETKYPKFNPFFKGSDGLRQDTRYPKDNPFFDATADARRGAGGPGASMAPDKEPVYPDLEQYYGVTHGNDTRLYNYPEIQEKALEEAREAFPGLPERALEKTLEKFILQNRMEAYHNAGRAKMMQRNITGQQVMSDTMIANKAMAGSYEYVPDDEMEAVKIRQQLREEYAKEDGDGKKIAELEKKYKQLGYDPDNDWIDLQTGMIFNKTTATEEEMAQASRVNALMEDMPTNLDLLKKLNEKYYVTFKYLQDEYARHLATEKGGEGMTGGYNKGREQNLREAMMEAEDNYIASSRALLLNEEPGSGQSDPLWDLGRASKIALKGLLETVTSPKFADDVVGNTQDELNRSLLSIGTQNPDVFQLTKEQIENLEPTTSDMISRAAGATTGVAGQFLLLKNVVGMTRAVSTLRSALKTGNGLQRALVPVLDLTVADLEFQAIGAKTGEGAAFSTVMRVLDKVPGGKWLREIKSPLLKAMATVAKTDVALTSAGLTIEVLDATKEALLADENFVKSIEEHFGPDFDKDLIARFATNWIFGVGVVASNAKAKSRAIEDMRRFSEELRKSNHSEVADWVDNTARDYEMNRISDNQFQKANDAISMYNLATSLQSKGFTEKAQEVKAITDNYLQGKIKRSEFNKLLNKRPEYNKDIAIAEAFEFEKQLRESGFAEESAKVTEIIQQYGDKKISTKKFKRLIEDVWDGIEADALRQPEQKPEKLLGINQPPPPPEDKKEGETPPPEGEGETPPKKTTRKERKAIKKAQQDIEYDLGIQEGIVKDLEKEGLSDRAEWHKRRVEQLKNNPKEYYQEQIELNEDLLKRTDVDDWRRSEAEIDIKKAKEILKALETGETPPPKDKAEGETPPPEGDEPIKDKKEPSKPSEAPAEGEPPPAPRTPEGPPLSGAAGQEPPQDEDDLTKPAKYSRSRGGENPMVEIEKDGVNWNELDMEEVEGLAEKVFLTEVRGENDKGQLIGTIRVNTKEGAESFTVVFNPDKLKAVKPEGVEKKAEESVEPEKPTEGKEQELSGDVKKDLEGYEYEVLEGGELPSMENGQYERQIKEAKEEFEKAKLYGFNKIQFDRYGWTSYPLEIEKIQLDPKNDLSNEIRIGKGPNGKYTYGYSIDLSMEGRGFNPTIHLSPVNSREEAINLAIEGVEEFYDRKEQEGLSKKDEVSLNRIRKTLEGLKSQLPLEQSKPASKKGASAKLKDIIEGEKPIDKKEDEKPKKKTAEPEIPKMIQKVVEKYVGEPDPGTRNRELARDIASLAGKRNVETRQKILEQITGTKPPKAQSGIHAVEQAIKNWVDENMDLEQPTKEAEKPVEKKPPPKPKETSTPEKERKDGFKMVGDEKVERPPAIEKKVEGVEREIEFGTDKKVKAKLTVVEAEDVQPSHLQGVRNPKHFIPEAQPKERIDDVSEGASERIADDLNPEKITDLTTNAYSGAPVTNSRGEVIQGNNRAIGLKKYWNKFPSDPKGYKEYLVNNAERMGLDPEAIKKMKSPILLHVTNAKDVDAISLGQFKAHDMETGGKQAIEPKEAIRKAGDNAERLVEILTNTEGVTPTKKKVKDERDDNISLRAIINENAKQALDYMKEKGIITPTQYQSAFKNNRPTNEVKLALEGMLTQNLFDGARADMDVLFERMPYNIQQVLAKTSYLHTGPESLLPQIQSAIEANYEYVNSGMDATIEEWSGQVEMLTGETPIDRYGDDVIKLLQHFAGIKDQNSLILQFKDFARKVAGEQGLFPVEPLSKAEAFEQVFGIKLREDGQQSVKKSETPRKDKPDQDLDKGGSLVTTGGKPPTKSPGGDSKRQSPETQDDKRPRDQGQREPRGPAGTDRGIRESSTRPGLIYADREAIPEHPDLISSTDYQLDPDQVFGVNHALDHLIENKGKAFLLADGTGVGKTRQELAIADKYKQLTGKEVLIVTENEGIIKNNFNRDAEAMGINPKSINMTTYSQVRTGKFADNEYGLVIFDEAHNLKNIESQQSIQASKLKADQRIFATATPMDTPHGAVYFISAVTGRPEKEIYNRLGFRVKDVVDPRTNLVVGREIVLDKGNSPEQVRHNIIEIRNDIIEKGAMLRREYPFWGTFTEAQQQISNQEFDEHTAINEYWDEQLEQNANENGNIPPAVKMVINGQRSNEMSRFSEGTKVDAVYNQVLQDVKDGKKVVVIAEFIKPTYIKGLGREIPQFIGTIVPKLEAAGLRVAKIYGANKTQKAKANKMFQAGEVDVVVGTPKSASTGIDLDDQFGTQPRKLYMVTPNYSGNTFQQILGRVSRRNTKSPAEVVLVYNNTSNDIRRREIVDKKLAVLRAIQEGRIEEEMEIGDELMGIDFEGGGIEIKPGPAGKNYHIVEGNTWQIKDKLKSDFKGTWHRKNQYWMVNNKHVEALRDYIKELTENREENIKRINDELDKLFDPDKPVEEAEGIQKQIKARYTMNYVDALNNPEEFVSSLTPTQRQHIEVAYGDPKQALAKFSAQLKNIEQSTIPKTQPVIPGEPVRRTDPISKIQRRTIIPDYKKLGYVDITGSHIASSQDAADLFSIFRNPYYETMFIVFTKGNEVVKYHASTFYSPLKAPGIDGFSAYEMAKNYGADGFWVVHNHPSGDPTASTGDIATTKSIFQDIDGLNAGMAKPIQFKGHIVTNHDNYSILSRLQSGEFINTVLPYGTKQESSFKERMRLSEIGNQDAVLDRSMDILRHTGGDRIVLFLDARNNVNGFMPIEKNYSQRGFNNLIEKGKKENGVGAYMIIHNGSFEYDLAKNTVPEGCVDILNAKTGFGEMYDTAPGKVYDRPNHFWQEQEEYTQMSLDHIRRMIDEYKNKFTREDMVRILTNRARGQLTEDQVDALYEDVMRYGVNGRLMHLQNADGTPVDFKGYIREAKEIVKKVRKYNVDNKKQLKGTMRFIITEHIGNVAEATLMSNLFQEGIRRSHSLREREAIPFLIEGTNVPDALNRPDLQAIVENPSPRLQNSVMEIREYLNDAWDWLQENGKNIDAEMIRNYVTHLWHLNRKQANDMISSFTTNNRFLKKRKITSYKEGIEVYGLKPKTLDIAEIIRVYDGMRFRSVFNQQFIEKAKNISFDGAPIIVKKSRAPVGYKQYKHPAMTQKAAIPSEMEDKLTIFTEDLFVHPDVYRSFKVVMDTPYYDSAGIIRAYDLVNAIAKKGELSLSFFHHVALTETALALMGPIKTPIAFVKILQAALKGQSVASMAPDVARDMAKHAMQAGATSDYNAAGIQKFLDTIHSKLKNADIDNLVGDKAKEAARVITLALKEFNRYWDKALWDYIHDGLKLYAYAHLTANAPRRIKTDMDMYVWKVQMAQMVNDTFGGQNWEMLGLTPRQVQAGRYSLLSLDWTISTMRQAAAFTGWGNPLQYAKLPPEIQAQMTPPPNSNFKKWFKNPRRAVGQAFWLRGAIIFGLGTMLLNYLMRKKDYEEHPDLYLKEPGFWDLTSLGNGPGHLTHLFWGRFSDGTEKYVRHLKQFREGPEYVIDPISKIGGKAAPGVQLATNLFTEHSLGGYPNFDMRGKKGWDKILGGIKTVGKSFTPFMAQNMLRSDKDWTPINLAFPTNKGTTPGQTIELYKEGLRFNKETGLVQIADFEYIQRVYEQAYRNGFNAQDLFKTAMSRLKADMTISLGLKDKRMEELLEMANEAETAYELDKIDQQIIKLEKQKEGMIRARDFYHQLEEYLPYEDQIDRKKK